MLQEMALFMNKPYYLEKYKYCPLCSGKLFHKKDFIECGLCGHRIFENQIPCVNAIIENDKGEILLVVRRLDPYKGWFDFPGGFIQGGESIEKAIKREAKEEIGIEIQVGEIIANYPLEYEHRGLVYKLLTFYVNSSW